MDISGKLKLVNDTKEFGSNGFRKREVVVTTEEQYPQDILVEFIQDKCDLLNSYKAGDSVKIDINLRGREWESPQKEIKYFNSIQGWRIEKLVSDSGTDEIPPVPPSEAFQAADEINENEPDDLPF
ncbi:MAG: DUF3127 domain-containing protein [Bacteroidetes bacterium]|jgi:translation initiation factor IF-3|nr:MAG: hypothetical protein ABR90_00845 [Cryomorphaceae bacterium BACL29 MAG-121220-bin8]MDA0757653.1 DUF3127 domain-containing protein [Bacteroidota bacterium]MDA1018765.1 DUF3127 domain-containing protein [Bacteroidota bacterium]|tara:strand:- start:10767 stop:11144 length:378 start_codon:yes stop_codon:yes gene_type:complete